MVSSDIALHGTFTLENVTYIEVTMFLKTPIPSFRFTISFLTTGDTNNVTTFLESAKQFKTFVTASDTNNVTAFISNCGCYSTEHF